MECREIISLDHAVKTEEGHRDRYDRYLISCLRLHNSIGTYFMVRFKTSISWVHGYRGTVAPWHRGTSV